MHVSVFVAAGYFVTWIFHPNVAKNGEICVNTLKKDWKPTLGLPVMFFLYSPIPCLVSFTSLRYGKMLTIDPFMLSVISAWELSVRSTQHVFLFQYSWSFSCLELWFQCFCDHSYDAWICVVSRLFLHIFCFFGFGCQPLLRPSLPVSSRLVTETHNPG